MEILNKNTNLSQLVKEYSFSFQQDKPFPNISFNNFFNPLFLNKVLEEFPEEIISGQENHGTLFKARKNIEEDKKAVGLRHNFKAIIKDFIPPILLKLKK